MPHQQFIDTSGGEPLPPEVSNKFYEASGLRIHEAFGQTETTLSIGTFQWLEPKLSSIGKPSPLFKVKLLDENDQEFDICEEGEICVDLRDGPIPG